MAEATYQPAVLDHLELEGLSADTAPDSKLEGLGFRLRADRGPFQKSRAFC